MGTKQLLLIVLGVIIVGTSVFVGIDFFKATYDTEVIDMALIRLHEIGGLANKYFDTPEELGGGAGSYRGYSLPDQYVNDSDWRFRTNARNNRITITMISRQRLYQNQPYRLRAQFRNIGLFTAFVRNPSTNRWEKIYDVRNE